MKIGAGHRIISHRLHVSRGFFPRSSPPDAEDRRDPCAGALHTADFHWQSPKILTGMDVSHSETRKYAT